ncbi:MAG TPA: hypothetical protein VM285_11455, partial [Polyangia bacterium]|nr:hypothetical protein [Polyangia bacterium]
MDGIIRSGLFVWALVTLAACDTSPRDAKPVQPEPPNAERPQAPGADSPVAAEQKIPEPPADHGPTVAEDRTLLAELYLAFAAEPAGFADKVAALTSEQRRQAYGFLFCAAPRMLAAGQEGERTGAPVSVELPPEADELIEYQGPRDRARRTLLRQLAGEFVVVGRCIQSIDRGERQVVDGILARQAKNLEMMRATSGPGQSEKWDGRIRGV